MCDSFVTPMDPRGTHQAPLSMGFPRQEYWSRLPLPTPKLPILKGSNLNLPLHWWTCLSLYFLLYDFQFSSVQSLSRVWLFVTPWTAAGQASLSITNSQSLLKLMSIESVMPCNHLTLCHPLLLSSSIFPGIRVFLSASVLCIMWPKYRNFSFTMSFQWILRTDFL